MSYICSVCQKAFHNRGTLSHHKKLHGPGTECEVCGKVFKQSLERHIQEQHNHVKRIRTKRTAPAPAPVTIVPDHASDDDMDLVPPSPGRIESDEHGPPPPSPERIESPRKHKGQSPIQRLELGQDEIDGIRNVTALLTDHGTGEDTIRKIIYTLGVTTLDLLQILPELPLFQTQFHPAERLLLAHAISTIPESE